MKRNFIIISVIIIVLFTLIPTVFAAAESDQTKISGHYTYKIVDGNAEIVDFNTSIDDDITIPSTLGEYPVTSIGDYAFYECGALTNITISDSITNIENNSFCRFIISLYL